MKKKEFKIPLYDTRIILLEMESKEDASAIGKELKKARVNKEDVADVVVRIGNNSYNGGATYRNSGLKLFIILLYKSTTEKQRLNTLGHEKRHVEDFIIKEYNIEGIEAIAYIAGFLTEKLFI